MSGTRKPGVGRTGEGDEPRSFAPAKPATRPGSGPQSGDDPEMAAAVDGLAGDPAEGENTTSGTGANSLGGTGAPAGGDAHLGKDGRRLGDPMNARRQVPSSGATGGLNGGSGAD